MSNILFNLNSTNSQKMLDEQQKIVAKNLKNLADFLERKNSGGFLRRFFYFFKNQKNNSIKSLYIHGGVGRGKTMLMHNFYAEIHKTAKVYFHFNAFMQQVHENLRNIRVEQKEQNKHYSDELIEAVKRIVKRKKLICFDEFQVVDIADAMLLSRIFSYLFAKKVFVVFTSNSAPKDLYKNGLQRELFLEFVNRILVKNCQIIHLDSATDYRMQFKSSLEKRYFLTSKNSEEEVEQIIEKLSEGEEFKSREIKVWGRKVMVKKSLRNMAIFTFDELCKNNLAAADYRKIAQEFDLIFLLKLPKLEPEDVNESRRLTLLIDEIYENKTALIVLAQVEAEQIYQVGINQEAFKRTVSRFNEISSDYYWSNSKFCQN